MKRASWAMHGAAEVDEAEGVWQPDENMARTKAENRAGKEKKFVFTFFGKKDFILH